MKACIKATNGIGRAAWVGGLALVLSNCYETVGGDRVQPFAPSSNPAEQARGKIQQNCAYEPATYFGVGTGHLQERCACYAAGVVKLMSKEELDYYSNYGLIPTLSKDKIRRREKTLRGGRRCPGVGWQVNQAENRKGGLELWRDERAIRITVGARDHDPLAVDREPALGE
jgi:hypothetical protein